MKSFKNVGQNDKANKPVLLSEQLLQTSGIVGRATQKWCLFRLLPFIMAADTETCSYYVEILQILSWQLK